MLQVLHGEIEVIIIGKNELIDPLKSESAFTQLIVSKSGLVSLLGNIASCKYPQFKAIKMQTVQYAKLQILKKV